MKILIYDWIQDNHPGNQGGGVQYYQKNLIEELKERNEISSIAILSSGRTYDWRYPEIRIINLPSDDLKIRRYDLVNSGVPAPASNFFSNLYALSHQRTFQAFEKFLCKYGPFDVVHFNHFEGLPASVLKVKKSFPGMKIIFSMHDYYVLCPRVTLMYGGSEICLDNLSGSKCLSCHELTPHPVAKRRLESLTVKYPIVGKNLLFRILQKIFVVITPDKNLMKGEQGLSVRELFERWNLFVELLNENADHIVAVSDYVHRRAIEGGISKNLLSTIHNGIPEGGQFNRTAFLHRGRIVNPEGIINMIFMGNLTKPKGFYFLLDAFEKMPIALSSRIRLIIPGRRSRDAIAMERLDNLKIKLYGLVSLDGYSQKDLDSILKECDIGLLAHLCQETGPFTALEMICRGLPYLTSDLGGAPEFSNCPELTFKHGDLDDFIKKIQAIFNEEMNNGDFWLKCIKPLTLKEHVDQLMKLYGAAS